MTVDTVHAVNGHVVPEEQQVAAPLALVPTVDVADQLAAWVEAARKAAALAASLVRTSFVPAQFRGKPEEATAAILSGVELGLSPMAALKSFDIIQGVAAPRAITLRAVVQSQGHEVWVEEESNERAVVCGCRKGSDRVQRVVWDLDKARGLGLLSKDNWKKQPGAMLVARATAELCRRIASDAILGIPYSAEELWDSSDPADAAPVVEARGLRARAVAAKRSTRPATGPIPVVAEQPQQPQEQQAPVVDVEDVNPDPYDGQDPWAEGDR